MAKFIHPVNYILYKKTVKYMYDDDFRVKAAVRLAKKLKHFWNVALAIAH